MRLFYAILFLLYFSCSSQVIWAQSPCEGRVRDAKTLQALPSVYIRNLRTQKTVFSDPDGKFQLAAQPGDRIEARLLGYQLEQLSYQGQPLDFLLSEDNKVLDEVVVLGYGTAKKSDLTGASFQVSGNELVQSPVSHPLQALQGKAPGLQIINSGRPGAAPNIRIRGIGTALAGTSTLFVVDGILTDDISNLSLQDIQQVDVLKDASSTAIYGARGANGVIIISTKKGKEGLKVNLQSSTAIKQAAFVVPMANAEEYLNYIGSMGVNTSSFPKNNSDWYGSILRKALQHQHQLSLSAGQGPWSHYLSAGYLKDEGIVMRSAYERWQFRLNQQWQAHPQVQAAWTLSLASTDEAIANLETAYNNAYRAAPIIAGKVENRYGNTSLFQNVGNPILDLELNDQQGKGQRLQASAYLQWTLLPGLQAKSSIGFDQQSSKQKSYVPAFKNDNSTFLDAGGNQRNPQSNLYSARFQSQRWVSDQLLTFDKEVQDHRIKWLLGATWEGYLQEQLWASRKEVPAATHLHYLDAGNPNTSTNGEHADQWHRQAFLTRLNYIFRNQYLLSASLRRDGSSNFSKANRWANFPAFGLGWVLSEGPWLKSWTSLSQLKLRMSWAWVGNDRIPSDAYQVTVEPNLPYPFGGGLAALGSAITQIKDPNLRWEVTEEQNLGLDFGFFSGKLQGEFNLYRKRARDLLINVKVPSVIGDKDGMVLTNAASIQNQGMELSLSYHYGFGPILLAKTTVQASLNQNKVLGLNGGQPILDGGIGAAQFFTTKTDNGQPVGSFYVWNVLGVFQSDAEVLAYTNAKGQAIQPSASAGTFKYQDRNEDGKIDEEDRVYLGSYQAKYWGNWSQQFKYKQWTLQWDVLWSFGAKIYNGKRAFRQGLLDNVERSMAYGRWFPNSGIQNEPAANPGNLPASSYFLSSGDFIRLNQVNLQYQIPGSLLKPLGLASARCFLTGQNLFTWKKFSGFSPELSSSSPTNAGIELNAYPISKTLSLGLILDLP